MGRETRPQTPNGKRMHVGEFGTNGVQPLIQPIQRVGRSEGLLVGKATVCQGQKRVMLLMTVIGDWLDGNLLGRNTSHSGKTLTVASTR